MNKKSIPLLWRQSKESYRLPSENIKGKVESFTIVYSPPKGFEGNLPYILALISLEDSRKITSQVVDTEKIFIGMEVEPCLRRVYCDGDEGLIRYGTKFRVIR